MSTQPFSKVFKQKSEKSFLKPFQKSADKMLGAPGAVHLDLSQGADERVPTVNSPHLSVRSRQGRS